MYLKVAYNKGYPRIAPDFEIVKADCKGLEEEHFLEIESAIRQTA